MDRLQRMGQWLAQRPDAPEWTVSSPARRALSTARGLVTALGQDPDDLTIDDALYFTGVHGMLRALERVDDRWQRVMMVGHNPVMTSLLNRLAGTDIGNMPTCAIALIQFDMESWGLVDSTPGRMVAYQVPKELP